MPQLAARGRSGRHRIIVFAASGGTRPMTAVTDIQGLTGPAMS